jgi:hypothetical protein
MDKSLRVLAHPLALLAVALVLLNDFLFRPLFPSWLTGKLSDLGMLFFLPLLAGCLFMLLTPRMSRHWAGALAFALVVTGFVLLKASPGTSAWLSGTIGSLTGLSLRAVPDSTDLLVLPVMAGAAWLWFRPVSAEQSPVRWRLLLIPLVAFVALADAAMPDMGIDCLAARDGLLYARGGYGRTYSSSDGGLTWLQTEQTWSGQCGMTSPGDGMLVGLPDGSVMYRFQRGVSVEHSVDNGATWAPIGPFAPVSEAEEAYIRKTRSGNIYLQPPPLDALLDPASGSLLMAMGHQGVALVRPDGSWQWVDVDSYIHAPLRSSGVGGVLFLLSGELILSLAAGLIWLATAALRGRGRGWVAGLVVGWMAVIATAAALHPEIANNSYSGIVTVAGLVMVGLAALVLAILAVVTVKSKILPKLPFILLVAGLVFLPYLLWGLGILPNYWLAQALVGGLLAASLILIK